MLIQLNPVGGSHKLKSVQLSAQRTINFWPQKQGNERTYSQDVLTNFPGLKPFLSDNSGSDRGMFVHKSVLYKVTGNTLYRISAGGAATPLGTIPGSGRCIFAGLLSSVALVTGGVAYEWDGATLNIGTDIDFETPNSVTHLNNQLIYDGDGGRFAVTDPGEALVINALNYATAESAPDDTVRVYSKNQVVHMMGTDRIEPWWNSGAGNPPFNRVESGIIEVGLGALHSVGETKDALYFYGSDDLDYILQGYNAVAISDEAMAREFKTYAVKEDAIGFCLTIDKKNFRFLTFPSANKTWVYQEGQDYFELQSNGGRWYGNSAVRCYGKNLVADYRNGNIYELDNDTYTDAGTPISRTRISAPIHGGLFQAPGKRVFLNRLEFLMETAVGLPTGQGSDPELTVSISEDGGKTFGTEMRVKLGNSDPQQKIELFGLGSFYNGVLKIEYSDPTAITIFGMAGDVEIGI